jgi:hypothetical protein
MSRSILTEDIEVRGEQNRRKEIREMEKKSHYKQLRDMYLSGDLKEKLKIENQKQFFPFPSNFRR